MKIPAKEVHRRLRELLGPAMKDGGFQRVPGASAAWRRREGGNWLVFWFQCDKWGWDDQWGSRLTVEFQHASSSEAGAGSPLDRMRLPSLLDTADLDIMRARNNLIIESMPGFRGRLQTYVDVDGERIVLLGKDIASMPYEPRFDVWLEYLRVEDIDFWAFFLLQRFDALIAAFLERAGDRAPVAPG